MKRLAVAALVLLVLGCASAPGSNISPLMDRLGKVRTAQPPRGEALIIFIRENEDSAIRRPPRDRRQRRFQAVFGSTGCSG
jgi:hypothetical protein